MTTLLQISIQIMHVPGQGHVGVTPVDASHFDTVQFRHSAISTQKRHFDTETLQKVSHFDTALDVSTHFLTNAYLCLFMGFHYMDFILVD